MKNLILTFFAAFIFVGVITAECTVTTDCGTFTYDATEISATSSNGVVTVSSNGNVIDQIACSNSSVSVSCSGEGGDDGGNNGSSICDFLPAWLAQFFGC